MNLKLHHDDARVLDLLLDRVRIAADRRSFAGAAAPPERVRIVENVLSLLEWLPEVDPPADLLRRTLNRIDGSLETVDGRQSPHIAVGTSHPVA